MYARHATKYIKGLQTKDALHVLHSTLSICICHTRISTNTAWLLRWLLHSLQMSVAATTAHYRRCVSNGCCSAHLWSAIKTDHHMIEYHRQITLNHPTTRSARSGWSKHNAFHPGYLKQYCQSDCAEDDLTCPHRSNSLVINTCNLAMGLLLFLLSQINARAMLHAATQQSLQADVVAQLARCLLLNVDHVTQPCSLRSASRACVHQPALGVDQPLVRLLLEQAAVGGGVPGEALAVGAVGAPGLDLVHGAAHLAAVLAVAGHVEAQHVAVRQRAQHDAQLQQERRAGTAAGVQRAAEQHTGRSAG